MRLVSVLLLWFFCLPVVGALVISNSRGLRWRPELSPTHHDPRWNPAHQVSFAKAKEVCQRSSVIRGCEGNQKGGDGAIFGVSSDVAAPLAALLVGQLVLFIGVGAIIPTLPLYTKEIGLSSAMSGVLISAPAVALLLLARPAGGYADESGRKPAMIGGLLLIAVSDVGTALAPSLPPLILARLGLGAGRALSESGERAMLADLAGRAPDLRGRALGAQQAAAALGIAVGAPLGGAIAETYGVRWTFICVSIAATLTALIYTTLSETLPGRMDDARAPEDEASPTIAGGSFADAGGSPACLPETLPQESECLVAASVPSEPRQPKVDGEVGARQTAAEEVAPAAGSLPPEEGELWLRLLADNRWRGLALASMGTRFGSCAKVASVPLIAASVLPGGATAAGSLLAAAGLSGLAGAPLGGLLSDRVGARSTAVLSGAMSSVALLAIPLALTANLGDDPLANGVAFAGLILLWSTGVAAQGPALTAVAQELAPKGNEATALALPKAVGDAVYIVAPFLLGVITDRETVLGTECAVAGALSLLGAVGLQVLTPERADAGRRSGGGEEEE